MASFKTLETCGISDATPPTEPDHLAMEEAVPVGGDCDGEGRNALDASARRRRQLAEAGLVGSQARVDMAKRTSARHGFAVPSTAEEIEGAKGRWGEDAWQMRALRFINSEKVQRFLVCLLVLDVFVLFSELAIDAFVPSCKFVIRDAISCCPSAYGDDFSAYSNGDDMHRLLGGGGGGEICAYPLEETDHKAGCNYNKYPGVHYAHKALFWTTVVILGTFLLELLALIYLIGPKLFFGQLTYVVDLIVVTLSLALELMFRYASEEALSVVPGILVVFRLWRFVRIGHGLVSSTYELQERKIHLAIEYIEELEEKVTKYEKEAPSRPKRLKYQSLSSSLIKSQAPDPSDFIGDDSESGDSKQNA